MTHDNHTANTEPGGDDASSAPVPGVLWASEIDVAPEASIWETYAADGGLDASVWAAVQKFRDSYGLDIGRDTTFESLDVVPPDVLDAAGLGFTRAQVVEFVNEYAYPLTDPDEAMAGLKAQRHRHRAEKAERHRERARVTRSLTERGIAASSQYTLAEIESVCGDQPYVLAARELIDRTNAEAWALRRRDDERLPIVTAAELHKLGAPVEDIAKLTPATPSDRIDAATELAVAHDKFRAGVSRRARTTGTGTDALDAATMTAEEVENQPGAVPLVKGLVYERTLTHIIGDPGTYKSFAAFGMACSLATGIPFGGEYAVSGDGVPVLYIAGEGSPGYAKRQSAWRSHHHVPMERLQANLTFVRRAVQLGSEEDTAWLRAKVEEIGAKVVVIDTQAMSTAGLEENSATDQGEAIQPLRDLITDSGAAVMVVHHTTRGSDHARGSSAWLGAVDTVLLMRLKKSDTAKLVTMVCAKQKEHETGCTHEFEAVTLDAPTAAEPNGTSLVLRAVDAAEAADNERKAISEKHVEVLTVIRDLAARTPAGVSQSAISTEAYNRELYSKPRASQCNAVVALLLNRGYAVDRSRGGSSAKKIVLADTPPQGGWPGEFDPKPALLVGQPAELDPDRPEHEAAVRRVLDTLGALRAEGSVHAKTTQRTFIGSYASGEHEQIVATAWERWVNEGRPDTSGISACYVKKSTD